MQAKNFMGGMRSSPKLAGGGLKKPTYTGADRARSSSQASQGKQAANYRYGAKHAGGGGGAKASSSQGYPGAGPMPSGSAYGSLSYPTRNSAGRDSSKRQNTLVDSKVRRSSSSRGGSY